eukprot:2413934-Pyramimonas_sp.AAC.1
MVFATSGIAGGICGGILEIGIVETSCSLLGFFRLYSDGLLGFLQPLWKALGCLVIFWRPTRAPDDKVSGGFLSACATRGGSALETFKHLHRATEGHSIPPQRFAAQ